jgi:hypothetical protein
LSSLTPLFVILSLSKDPMGRTRTPFVGSFGYVALRSG